MLCASLEDAVGIAKQHNVDCITIEGDEVSRKGSLTGGYQDQRRSRLALFSEIRSSRERVDELNRAVEKHRNDLTAVDALINRCALYGERERE